MANGQDTIALRPTQQLTPNVREYKKGIYRSFREFQTNSPSEYGELVTKTRSTLAQLSLQAKRSTLKVINATGQEQKPKSYWGFSDGKDIYVKDNGLNKLLITGYYCLYEIPVLAPARSAIDPATMTINNTTTASNQKKVINIVSGEVYELTPYNLKKYILPQDPELLAEFNADKARKDQLEYYIRRFNLQNQAGR
ncbi:hypothetical protein [Chitinophaga defluvii]|uniref:GLPGLI family protein n=1 Tax=Chitinophaga defluvii TaxID=3163343 RepID=A0ABV2T881_9BACT